MQPDHLPLRIEDRASGARRISRRAVVHEAIVVIDIE